jgi:HK97 family phage prohead protease
MAMDNARIARAEAGNGNIETRTLVSGVTLRAKSGAGATFEGYAAMYGSRTWIGAGAGPNDDPWGFYEEVMQGAFDNALRADGLDCVCLINHDVNHMLGRTKSGTLRLASDATGLHVTNDLPATNDGRDLAVLVERGDVTGMSFSFMVAPGGERWSVLPDGGELRQLFDFGAGGLYDVSPCVMPAYGDTSASVRDAVKVARRNAPQRAAQLSEKESDKDDNGSEDDGGKPVKKRSDEISGDDGTLSEPEDIATRDDMRELWDRYDMHSREIAGDFRL